MIECYHNAKIFSNVRIENAVQQIQETAKKYPNSVIRVMPDYHVGSECTIGLTMKTTTPVSPRLVGADIGCGVLSFKIKEHLDLQQLDDFIHKNIPVGFNVGEPNEKVLEFLHGLRCFEHLTKVERLSAGVGSLGSGNHFIEVEQDEEGYQYLTVHTGSRNLGIQVSEYYSKLFDNQEPFWDDYINDLKMTQYYAERNRQKILFDICIGLNLSILDIIESVHNYFDGLFVRKGAIDASKGKRVIIPMNMRDGVILGTGLGNEEWNFSAPHGAGRILSRKQAKTQVKLEDFQKSMEGIYTTTCNQNTIDEACFAYKPTQEILDVIGETITVDKVIKPIYNFKGF